MDQINLLDLHGVDRQYFFEVISKDVKKGKVESTQKWIVFHTKGEDDLHFIEDIAEEICKKKNLPVTTSHFFEKNKDGEWWKIQMRWDNGRYRGTCFVILPEDPTIEKNLEKEVEVT